jgi:hypothetical protein
MTTLNEENVMTNEPAKIGNSSGWHDAAEAADNNPIRGILVKYAKGEWKRGKEGELVPAGTQLRAEDTREGYVRWKDSRPEYHLRQPGGPPVQRAALGDDDERLWEVDDKGESIDPFKWTRIVYFTDPETEEAFTFPATTWSGLKAVENLADQIKRKWLDDPGALAARRIEHVPG